MENLEDKLVKIRVKVWANEEFMKLKMEGLNRIISTTSESID